MLKSYPCLCTLIICPLSFFFYVWVFPEIMSPVPTHLAVVL